MKVEQLMSREVGTCHPDDTLNDAARVMWECDCGGVPVVAADGTRRVVGMLTDRDVCMAAYFQGRGLGQIRVSETMSTCVHACRPGDALREAEALMRSAQVHRLPVVDEAGALLGILSLADLAGEAAREVAAQGAKRPRVRSAEVGETLAEICRPRKGAVQAAPAALRAAPAGPARARRRPLRSKAGPDC